MSNRDAWKVATCAEIDFWREWLETGGLKWPDDYRARLDPDTPIDERVVNRYIARLKRPAVSILDVGAGPLTSLGKRHPRARVEITAIDPLAPEYDRLLDQFGISPPVRTLACEGERLLDLFAPKTFDIVHARNSLDHAYDPFQVVRNMVTVAKPGGLIFMRHFVNEGQRVNCAGLHQWNFNVQDGHLVLWQEQVCLDVSQLLVSEVTMSGWYEGMTGNGLPLWVVTRAIKPIAAAPPESPRGSN